MTHVGARTVTQLKDILILSLAHNNINYLERNSLSGLNELDTLDLSYNLIKFLQENIFDDLSSLDILMLSGNRIMTLESLIFSDLLNLKILRSSENDLYNISDNTLGVHPSRFTKLNYVDLSKNRLQGFPLWLLKASYLSSISLDYNDVSFIGVRLLLSKMSKTGFRPPELHRSARIISIFKILLRISILHC